MLLKMLKKMMVNLRIFIRDKTINRDLRKNTKKENISIIASDCIGGVLYKALHRRMDSPTINMFFSAGDFIKLCKNIDYYLEQRIVSDVEVASDETWPVGRLGDIKVHLVHYKSVEEANEKWEERKKRVHRDALYFMMNDRNGCTEEDIAAFDSLPYENKVIFTHLPYPQYKSAFYIPGSEKDACIKITTAYVSWFSIKRRYDDFDVAAWINQGIYRRTMKRRYKNVGK